jgi:hypothetical protein
MVRIKKKKQERSDWLIPSWPRIIKELYSARIKGQPVPAFSFLI